MYLIFSNDVASKRDKSSYKLLKNRHLFTKKLNNKDKISDYKIKMAMAYVLIKREYELQQFYYKSPRSSSTGF